MTNAEKARRLADAVFALPQGVKNDRTQRLAFKGGKWPLNETDLGGICKEPFALLLEDELNKLDAVSENEQ